MLTNKRANMMRSKLLIASLLIAMTISAMMTLQANAEVVDCHSSEPGDSSDRVGDALASSPAFLAACEAKNYDTAADIMIEWHKKCDDEFRKDFETAGFTDEKYKKSIGNMPKVLCVGVQHIAKQKMDNK
jgi:hypothetical protein